jgi:hypothetical protein
MRVVAEHRVVGDSVRMTVALPFSKFDFTEQMQSLFKNAVRTACGVDARVLVDEVADKPKDFKGGGLKTPCAPPPHPRPRPDPERTRSALPMQPIQPLRPSCDNIHSTRKAESAKHHQPA